MEKFEEFCKSNSTDGGFLQSNHWKKFQESLGRKTSLVTKEFFSMQMIFHELPLVRGYYFVPRGPIMKGKSAHTLLTGEKLEVKSYFDEIINKIKNDDVGWIRVEPQTDDGLKLVRNALEGKYSVIKSKKNHEPAQTLMIDLDQQEDEILAQMKSKTRYNIRLAGRKGVKVIKSREKKYFEKFIELTTITAKRDKITVHPNEYYKKMIENIPDDVLKLYFAKYEDKIISAIMVSFYGGIATYLHGASSDEHRNTMAPFMLQWEAMKDAKSVGCKKYDLGGTKIGEKGELEGSWSGITKFKQGFCPNCKPVEFPGCWDIVLDNKKYNFYRILQNVKELKNKIRSL